MRKKITVSEHHSFDVNLATEIGLEAAIILKDLHYEIRGNRGKEYYQKDGKLWTYLSLNDFANKFPYINRQKIWRILIDLEAQGFIIKGNHNRREGDKTTWYTLTDKAWEIFSGEITEQDFIKAQIPTTQRKKTSKTVARPEVEGKWAIWFNFIWEEFSTLYPVHKNKEKTMQAAKEFSEDVVNYVLTEKEIAEIIEKIRAHYLVYCAGCEFPVGPWNYITNRKWTEALTPAKKGKHDVKKMAYLPEDYNKENMTW